MSTVELHATESCLFDNSCCVCEALDTVQDVHITHRMHGAHLTTKTKITRANWKIADQWGGLPAGVA